MNDPLQALNAIAAPTATELAMPAEKKHSTLGPSAASRWKNCPGSIRLSQDLSRSPGNKYSAEGTVAHSLAEAAVNGATFEQLAKRVGDTVMEDGFEIEIDEEMVDAAIEYRDLIATDAKAIQADGKSIPLVGRAELRVVASSIDAEVRGTADYILFQKGNKLKVYDFKYGKRAVAAFQNDQMGCYAHGAMDTLAGPAFDEVELIICQPRAGGTRRWIAPKEWLAKFKAETREAAALTRLPNAPVVAGPWCRYCPAADAGCPVAHAAVQAQAQIDFGGVAPVAVKGAGLPDVALLPMSQMVQALEWEEFVVDYFSAIRARIHADLSAGKEVKGLKLVEGKANRIWKDEAAVVAEYEGVLGGEALYKKKLISPAALEKIVGKKKIDHLTTKPEGKPVIAKSDDPRKAFAPRTTAIEDFSAVSEDAARGATVGGPMTYYPDPLGDPLADDPLAVALLPEKVQKKLWP